MSMTLKEIKKEIIRNLGSWFKTEIIQDREILYRANIIVKGIQAGKVYIFLYPEEKSSPIRFYPQAGNPIDIKSYEGTYNLEYSKNEAIDYVARLIKCKYKNA